jgi:hypothetical protein
MTGKQHRCNVGVRLVVNGAQRTPQSLCAVQMAPLADRILVKAVEEENVRFQAASTTGIHFQ